MRGSPGFRRDILVRITSGSPPYDLPVWIEIQVEAVHETVDAQNQRGVCARSFFACVTGAKGSKAT